MLDGYYGVTLAVEESSSILRITHQIGARFPLTIGAHSKVFAAYMSEELVRHILQSQKTLSIRIKTHQYHRVYPKPFGELGNKAMVSATKRSPGGVRALAAPVRDSKVMSSGL